MTPVCFVLCFPLACSDDKPKSASAGRKTALISETSLKKCVFVIAFITSFIFELASDISAVSLSADAGFGSSSEQSQREAQNKAPRGHRINSERNSATSTAVLTHFLVFVNKTLTRILV
jgi:hypothetical protein